MSGPSVMSLPRPGYQLAIVGGCGGMGRALTDVALQAGLEVTILDMARAIDTTDLREGVRYLPCDVSREAEVKAAFAELARSHEFIDGVINFAGYTGERIPVDQLSADEWDAIHQACLRGSFLVAREAAPLLRQSARQGRRPGMILVSSTFGVRVPHVGYAAYATAKAGVINLVRSLATEWAPDIRVNGIAPGVIDTPFLRGGTGRPAKSTGLDAEKFLSTVPLKRLGEPEDIAWPALFLLSEGAAYIAGQTLHVNGGSMMP